jgi:hypothetical protein
VTPILIPTTWSILHQAINQKRAVRATYHDRLRIICPHALGWKNGSTKAFVYQTAILDHPSPAPRGWRSLFVDEIQDPHITDDQWHTAANYDPNTTGIDTLAAAIT